jgi:hypothetical protein
MLALKEVKNLIQLFGIEAVVDCEAVINGKKIRLTPEFLKNAFIEGVYRQLSMELASGDTEANRAEIIARFERGYLKAADEKRATQVIEVKGSKGKVPFTQTEILAEARGLTKDKKALEVLDKISQYDSDRFGLVLLSVSDKPDSLISKAIKELTERKVEKDKAIRDALMSELDVI